MRKDKFKRPERRTEERPSRRGESTPKPRPRSFESESRELRIRGRKPVIEALKKGIVLAVELNASAHGNVIREIETLAARHSVPITRMVGRQADEEDVTQGVQAVIRRVKARTDLPDFVDSIELAANPLLLMLDGIEDPHNFGAILRSAYSANVAGVITRSRRQAPLNDTVFKTSAGCAALVPVFEVNNLEQTVRSLKESNWWAVAANRSERAVEYHRIDWKRPTLLIVGAEGKGVSELLLKRSDDEAAITMRADFDSLNVSVATGILLFEADYQRALSSAQDST